MNMLAQFQRFSAKQKDRSGTPHAVNQRLRAKRRAVTLIWAVLRFVIILHRKFPCGCRYGYWQLLLSVFLFHKGFAYQYSTILPVSLRRLKVYFALQYNLA